MIEWLNFFMCAIMGWTGVHKFKERKVAVGTLYFLTVGLCGVGWIYDTIRYLIIALKRSMEISRVRSKRLDENEELLPIEKPELLELSANEICYYEQNAACVSGKAVREPNKGGICWAVGADKAAVCEPGKTARINWGKAEELLGCLYVTNRRVVITDGRAMVECTFRQLSGIRLYRNLLVLKAGERDICIATDEAVYAYQIIMRVYES